MKVYALMLSAFLIQGCETSETKSHFNYLDITYFNVTPLAYSLRFTSSDTVFYLQFFSNYPIKGIVDGSIYYGMLKKEQSKTLDSFLTVMNFQEYKPDYRSGDLDGEEFKLYYNSTILYDSVEGDINRAPLEIRKLMGWVKEIKPLLKFNPYQGQINWNGSSLWLSPPPADTVFPKVGQWNAANEQ